MASPRIPAASAVEITVGPSASTSLSSRSVAFAREMPSYMAAHYNEAQTRQEFIDPFFAALGWDMENKQEYAEAYKEVIHEDSIKIAGEPKAPDYCLRIGGVRKFFVEAKRPGINITVDSAPSFIIFFPDIGPTLTLFSSTCPSRK